MRIFKHWHRGTTELPIICPICGTQDDDLCTGVYTQENEFVLVHVKCLDLRCRFYNPNTGSHLIYQEFQPKITRTGAVKEDGDGIKPVS